MLQRTTTIPVIDLSAIGSADPIRLAALGHAVRDACESSGFFYVAGHGVPDEVIRQAFEMSRAWFDQPVEVKLRTGRDRSPCFRGYDPLRNQTLEAGAPPDVKEGFLLGTDLPADDPYVRRGVYGLGANQWPDDWPEFRAALETYHRHMTGLGLTIMRALALSLELPIDHFDGYSRGPMARTKLLHYPPQPAHPLPDEKGCGAHTDFGGITVLAQDDCGGLQVWSDAQGWLDAPPLSGTFVVNLGDMMARWTNDRYRSTLHRVINASGRERFSIPFFMSGDPDYEVACLPNCCVPGEAPKYPPITVQDHFSRQHAKSYA
jgi:isopenicillin N synthase-like dioxygenase